MQNFKLHIFTFVAFFVPLFESCTPDLGGAGETDSAIVPTSGMAYDIVSPPDNLKEGDIVWVWADRYGTSDGYIKAWKLTATGVDGGLYSPRHYNWPSTNAGLSIQAFRGNFVPEPVEEQTSLESLEHAVSTDQGTEEARNGSDLLYALLSPARHQANLSFSHLLSKIVVELQDTEIDDGSVSGEALTHADMKLCNLATRVSLDTEDRKAVCHEPYSDIGLGSISEGNLTASAIIPPQAVDSGVPFFELTLHDFPKKDSLRTFHFIAPSQGLAFESGRVYTYVLSVKNLIRATAGDIEEWEDVDKDGILQWPTYIFGNNIMDWNGNQDYSHLWAWFNFPPTVDGWNEDSDSPYQWSWFWYPPTVNEWNEREVELPEIERQE